MKLISKVILTFFLVILILLGSNIYRNLRERHPGYKPDLKISASEKGSISAGFSAVSITPAVPDTWQDNNGDATYNPGDGDTFTDGNGNGKFDPVWIAGFGNKRAAAGIHDELWARTMVIDDGRTRIAITSLDVIGFMNNNVIEVRKMLPEEYGIDYLVISCTHNHEGPDLLGLWGKSYFSSGVDKNYLGFVKEQIVKSMGEAAAGLRPAVLELSGGHDSASVMVKDTRMPEVFDNGLYIMRAADRKTGSTLGTLISWGNHPETLWGKNLLITSDFPHYLRKYTEEGIFKGDTIIARGTGGTTVFINGAVGGLMTTHPSVPVTDPVSGKVYNEPTFEKADAQGKMLALFALNAMKDPVERIDSASVNLIARGIDLPIKNKFFRLGTMFGILDRGTTGWMKMKSELAVFNIGSASFATLPGEVYPELVNGGIEEPEGADFTDGINEAPPLRDMMTGKIKFIIGLGNDEIGYIIPRSQWDVKAPFTYGRESAPYGEENSLGPETAGIIHSTLKEMLMELNNN